MSFKCKLLTGHSSNSLWLFKHRTSKVKECCCHLITRFPRSPMSTGEFIEGTNGPSYPQGWPKGAEIRTYSGGCHCGRIRYEFDFPDIEKSKVITCNCSICAIRGALNMWVYNSGLIFILAYLINFLFPLYLCIYATILPLKKPSTSISLPAYLRYAG